MAPLPLVFNILIERILNIPKNGEIIFNCQMGRGRTTTGLVITFLMRCIVSNKSILEISEYIPYEPAQDESNVEHFYKQGNYEIVTKLISVLQYGKLSKYITDQAIDACGQVQNLRNAIYDYREKLETINPGTESFKNIFEIGCNYLVRYFYLITFTDYLIEEWSVWEHSNPERGKQFSVWLSHRQEILNLIKTPHLD